MPTKEYLPELPTVDVEGFSRELQWDYNAPYNNPVEGGNFNATTGEGSGGGGGESFVAPFVLPDLPEVVVEAAKPKPLPPAALPIVDLLVGIARDFLLPVIGLFTPLPSGPQYLDEAPDPEPELDPVEVTGTPRKPPATATPRFAEPSLPPNWQDLVHEYDFDGPGTYLFPIPGDPRDFREVGTDLDRRVFPISDDPGLFEDPYGLPEFPFPSLDPKPRVRPSPDTTYFPVGPTFDPLGDPSPFYIGDPFGDVGTEPYVPTGPEPRTVPAPTYEPFPDPGPDLDFPPRVSDPVEVGVPDYVAPPKIGLPITANPFDPFTPSLPQDPGTLVNFDPDEAGTCDCTKVKDKKPKREKKPGRTICYRGTYTEHSKGLTKRRKEQVPCDAKADKAPKAKSPRKKKSPTLHDVAKDVFQLPN